MSEEGELQKYCIGRLLAHPDVWGWRNNTGVSRRGKRFIRYGYPGSADFIGLLSNGRFLAVEFKSENGDQSEDQEKFEKKIKEKGGVYMLISSMDEFEKFYRDLWLLVIR